MGISIFERGQEHSGFTLIRDSTSEFDRPRQRRHEVLILTCYVNFDCIKRLIKELRGTIRVTDFFLAFDILIQWNLLFFLPMCEFLILFFVSVETLEPNLLLFPISDFFIFAICSSEHFLPFNFLFEFPQIKQKIQKKVLFLLLSKTDLWGSIYFCCS